MVIAEERDSAGAKPLHGKREISKARVACQGLTQQAYGSGIDRVARAAGGLSAHGLPQPATRAQFSNPTSAFMIPPRPRRLRRVPLLPGSLRPLFLFCPELTVSPLEE